MSYSYLQLLTLKQQFSEFWSGVILMQGEPTIVQHHKFSWEKLRQQDVTELCQDLLYLWVDLLC